MLFLAGSVGHETFLGGGGAKYHQSKKDYDYIWIKIAYKISTHLAIQIHEKQSIQLQLAILLSGDKMFFPSFPTKLTFPTNHVLPDH
jgi:hypothetical protein